MEDIIIIGAGPAGLTSAIYCLRANKKVKILESNGYGGQIIKASNIENYPGIKKISGIDFATNLYNQVIDLGGDISYETVLKVTKDKTVITNKNKYQAKIIIIATGSSNKKLMLDNEDRLVGSGISYCGTCDGNFYKDKVVAVVGGGNTALEDTLYLANIASKVYLIHRRNSFRGEDKSLDEIKKKSNVEIILNSNVIEIKGENKLEKIVIKDNEDNIKELEIDGLFIAIGQKPNNEIFSDVVDVDDMGYIKTKDSVLTKTKGILVAGDARAKDLRQLTTAVSDGSLAAYLAIKELNEK